MIWHWPNTKIDTEIKNLKRGERYVTVFNDAILIISYEDKTIHFDVIVGDPCIINKNIEEI